jgi:hypothetical protein
VMKTTEPKLWCKAFSCFWLLFYARLFPLS